MGRPIHSRYQQLGVDQRAKLTNPDEPISVSGGLSSFTGPPENLKYFDKSLTAFRELVTEWPTGKAWVHAFVKRCNCKDVKSKRSYDTIFSQFKNGFAKYLKQQEKTGLQLNEYGSDLIASFYSWLESDATKMLGGGRSKSPRAESTARRYFQQFRILIEELQVDSVYGAELSKLEFPNISFSGAAASEKKTEVLDDQTFKALYQGCKDLVLETITKASYATQLFGSDPPAPLELERKDGNRYRELPNLLFELNRRYPGPLPSLAAIRARDGEIASAIQYIHGGYRIIQEYFQPSADTLIPFMVLMSVYTQANTGPLRSLRKSNVSTISVLGKERICLLIEKVRAQYSYKRSFALDQSDPLSPDQLFKFLESWTGRVRSVAEAESVGNLFIFSCQSGRVRSFFTAVDVGTDSDASWRNALRNICKGLGLPAICNGEIRVTGLDVVREASNDDVRAVKAAGGQKSEGTIKLHYEGAGAARRRNEDLSEVMATAERWVASGGRRDPRGEPAIADIHAATPGWGCVDAFHSPILGEVDGRLCAAFGSCPICPHGTLNSQSAYSLARVLQLDKEVKLAMEYLDFARWKSSYEGVAIALRDKWIPSFSNPQVWEEACQLNLGAIGRLE